MATVTKIKPIRLQSTVAAEVAAEWFNLIVVMDTLGNPVAMFERVEHVTGYLNAHPGYTAGVVKHG